MRTNKEIQEVLKELLDKKPEGEYKQGWVCALTWVLKGSTMEAKE